MTTGGQPADGAVVNVYSEAGVKMDISGTTDANGQVTLGVPANGDCHCSISADKVLDNITGTPL